MNLAHLEIESGVSAATGLPFVSITATGEDGTVMSGQLDSAEARAQGFYFLEAAEAAEHDAAVMAALTSEIGLELGQAAAFVGRLRATRTATIARMRQEQRRQHD